ncbi:unnamed protein product [Caenorhabditis nigoni]
MPRKWGKQKEKATAGGQKEGGCEYGELSTRRMMNTVNGWKSRREGKGCVVFSFAAFITQTACTLPAVIKNPSKD